MKFFLDSADVGEIRRALDAGLIDGITTNPSLLAQVAGANHDPLTDRGLDAFLADRARLPEAKRGL